MNKTDIRTIYILLLIIIVSAGILVFKIKSQTDTYSSKIGLIILATSLTLLFNFTKLLFRSI